jgi:group I intron endonuclease
MTIGIYMITNKMNNKKYIGQSINIKRRKSEHFTKHCNKMVISNAIFKYGKENFDFEILKECDESQLNELEIKYITEYKSNNREFGYNVDNGGNGTGKLSEETKQKLRELNLGVKNAFYGKIHTDEIKQKIKEHHKNNENYAFHGKKHTEERNQKLSIKNKENDWNNRGKGILYYESCGKLNTNFNGKSKHVTIKKYPNLAIPLIICTRICMENEIDFKSNLIKDIENFVQKFDLKTLINID